MRSAISIKKVMDKSDEGYESLAFYTYIASIASDTISWSFFTGNNILQLLSVAIIIIALLLTFAVLLRWQDAISDVPKSHLGNIRTMAFIGFAFLGVSILVGVIGTKTGEQVNDLDILIIAFGVILSVWFCYRSVIGLVRLNDGDPYSGVRTLAAISTGSHNNSYAGAGLGAALNKSEAGFRSLLWVLYGVTLATFVLSIVPSFLPVSIIIGIIVFVVAIVRRPDARGTIYSSHFSNIILLTLVGVAAAAMFLIFAVATLGVGSVVAIPLIILVAIWQIYRLVKGIFRLSDGRPMGDKAIAIGAVAEVSELEREIAASTRGNKSTPPPLPGS